MKLNVNELSILTPAVVYGWEIHCYPYKKACHWDGDTSMPVTVGKTVEKLIESGYLVKYRTGVSFRIQATDKANALKCKSGSCSQGSLVNELGDVVGKCPECRNGLVT